MNILKIDTTKAYTPTAYSKKVGESVQLIKYWMKTGRVKTVKVHGAVLVYEG
jgi:hypothetical protein